MGRDIFEPRARTRAWAIALAAAAVGLATGGAAAQANDIQVFTSGAHFYKRVVTNPSPQTTSILSFAPLPGARTTVFVPPQSTVLVNVGFDAETRCSGGGQQQAWCELRITIGGVEGSPQSSISPGTFAMDSTDGGTEGIGSWESHAVTRHRCIRNTTNSPMPVVVNVDWQITNFTPAAGVAAPEFWVDDSSLVVELARGCTESRPVGVDATPSVLRAAQPSQGGQ